jgi:SAM-dependent methyltransferase
MTMDASTFDDLTDVYEAMIDWPKRLANDGPFLRRIFDAAGVRSVADVACGTGRHAAMFHAWGLRVQGSDLSPNMIRRAREAFGEPDGLRWLVRDFEQPPGDPGAFDAAVCLGNSLALAPDEASVGRALGAMFEAVRPGGVVVAHVLNLWKLPQGPCVWQKVLRRSIGSRDVTIVKGVHRCGDQGRVELLVIPDGDEASFRAHSNAFLGLTPDLLSAAARPYASDVTFYGGAQGKPYDAATSTDLVLVAARRA